VEELIKQDAKHGRAPARQGLVTTNIGPLPANIRIFVAEAKVGRTTRYVQVHRPITQHWGEDSGFIGDERGLTLRTVTQVLKKKNIEATLRQKGRGTLNKRNHKRNYTTQRGRPSKQTRRKGSRLKIDQKRKLAETQT